MNTPDPSPFERARAELSNAFEQLAAALAELLLPTFEAFADAVERLADAWSAGRPVRWLNRRARRAAMRRHPAGRVAIVELQLSAGEIREYARAWHYAPVEIRRPSPFVRLPHVG